MLVRYVQLLVSTPIASVHLTIGQESIGAIWPDEYCKNEANLTT